jgi:hypothetical protein
MGARGDESAMNLEGGSRSLRSNPALYLVSRGCGPTQVGATPCVAFRAVIGLDGVVDLDVTL